MFIAATLIMIGSARARGEGGGTGWRVKVSPLHGCAIMLAEGARGRVMLIEDSHYLKVRAFKRMTGAGTGFRGQGGSADLEVLWGSREGASLGRLGGHAVAMQRPNEILVAAGTTAVASQSAR